MPITERKPVGPRPVPRSLPKPAPEPHNNASDPAPVQMLSTGESLEDSILAELGVFGAGVAMRIHPLNAVYLTCGRSGSGKSVFWQSCPHALIINADMSSTPKKPRAAVWPGLNSSGVPVIPNPAYPKDPDRGTPFELTWQSVLDMVKKLEILAQRNAPGRPRIIVVDTMDAIFPLVRDWVVKTYNERYHKVGDEAADDIDDIGQKAWAMLDNTILADFMLPLRRAGYGVAFVCHLSDKSVANKATRTTEIIADAPMLSPGLFAKLKGRAEVVGLFQPSETTTNIQKPRIDQAGKQILDTKGKPSFTLIPVRKRTVILSFELEDKRVAGSTETKKRYDYLDSAITLPIDNPWQTFEAAVNQAIAQQNLEDEQS